MPNREKVIKAWEIFRDSNPYEICDGREFRAIKEPEYCMGQMIEDTIALLKEQYAEETICKNCNNRVSKSEWNFCPYCGFAYGIEGSEPDA